VAGAFLTSTLLSGCLSDRSSQPEGGLGASGAGGESWVEAWDSTYTPSLPTLSELEAALGLTPEQSAVLAPALERWRDDVNECRESIRRRQGGPRHGREGSGGHGLPGGFGDFEPPVLAFLEAVVPVLEPAQITALVDQLPMRRGMDQPRPGRGPHGPGRGHHGMFMMRVLRQLDLNPEQRLAVMERVRDSRQQYHDLRTAFHDGTVTAEEIRDGAKEIRLALEEDLRSILDEEQFTRYQELLGEARAKIADRMLERLPEGIERRAKFLTRILTLTDEQILQVRAALEEAASRREAILIALRDGKIEIEDALYEGYLIEQDTKEAIRALLTPEQLEIFDALRAFLPGCGPFGPRR
jgi:hypothetical protein